jgi:hypothetical protein
VRLHIGGHAYDLHLERDSDVPRWRNGRLKATLVLTSAEQAYELRDLCEPKMGSKPSAVGLMLQTGHAFAVLGPALVRTFGPPRWLRLGYLLCDVEFVAYDASPLRTAPAVG